MNNYEDFLQKSKKSCESAEKLIFVLYPLLKDIHLLKKGLEEIGSCLLNCVGCFLSYEQQYSGLKLMFNGEANWHLFKRNSSKLGIKDLELELIEKILEIVKKHRESSFEFVKKDKIFITSSDFRIDSLDREDLKNYFSICKSLIISLENYLNYKKTGFIKS